MHVELPRERWPFWWQLWRLAAPVSLQIVLTSALGLVDMLMVGALGEAAIAGVGLINKWFFVLILGASGLSNGVGVLVAQAVGAQQTRALRGVVSAALLLGLICTLPLALAAVLGAGPASAHLTPDAAVAEQARLFLQWSAATGPLLVVSMALAAALRSHGDTHSPMWVGLLALALNTGLNYLFIQGRWGLPAGGVMAAGLATTVARALEVLVLGTLVWRLWRRQGPQEPIWVWPARTELRLVWRTCAPLALNEALWAVGVFAYQVVVSYMGARPLAILGLASPVETMVFALFVGPHLAAVVVLSQALGRADFAGAQHMAWRLLHGLSLKALACGLMLTAVAACLRWGWAGSIQVPGVAASLLPGWCDTLMVLGLGMALKVHNMMACASVLRSGNDTRFVLLWDVPVSWFVGVPLAALTGLVWHWPLPAVVACFSVEELIKAGLWRWRIAQGHWLRQVVWSD